MKRSVIAILFIATSAVLFSAAPALAESGGGISWKAPTSWKLDTSRPMRAATYTIAASKPDTETAELGVFFFGRGQGGSVDDNVKRWAGQFTDGKPATTKQEKVGAVDVVHVTIEGTYAQAAMGPMMGSAPPVKKPNWELYGAIVSGPQGPVFFKLVGPKHTIDATHAAFNALIKSITVDPS